MARKVTGWSQIAFDLLTKGRPTSNACIFYYHRVANLGFTDPQIDDRNVSPELFEAHLRTLLEYTEIVPVAELPSLLKDRSRGKRPLVSITFDDGYANFRTTVLPVLCRYKVRATLAVATGYVESHRPAPFDKWAVKNVDRVTPASWRILNWREIEECVATGLVTLGVHSHHHLRGSEASPSALRDDVETAAEMIRSRFGKDHTRVYAYPYGNSRLGDIPGHYEDSVRDAGFTVGLTTDIGLVSTGSNLLRLPRIEAHADDSDSTMRAKARGAIAPLYANDLFHQAVAWTRSSASTRQVGQSAFGDRLVLGKVKYED